MNIENVIYALELLREGKKIISDDLNIPILLSEEGILINNSGVRCSEATLFHHEWKEYEEPGYTFIEAMSLMSNNPGLEMACWGSTRYHFEDGFLKTRTAERVSVYKELLEDAWRIVK